MDVKMTCLFVKKYAIILNLHQNHSSIYLVDAIAEYANIFSRNILYGVFAAIRKQGTMPETKTDTRCTFKE
jgi:hypothetical protein